MKKIFTIAGFAVSALYLQSCGNNTSGKKQDSIESAQAKNESMPVANRDKNASDFLIKAASGGMLEVQLGQMAQQKGVSQRVKDFGLMMIRDHSKSNDELKAIAMQKGIAIPQTLSNEHQKHYEELNKQQGKDWDKDYIDLMLGDHKGDIQEFTEASEKIEDPAIKGFAKKNIPVLQMHLDSVKAIKESMK